MSRVTNYEIRRKDILRAVIELYLETARPVSSEILLERYKFDFSAATIRNVLKDLEELGYLTHPHTSAGREPTDKGYRFYINDLMLRRDLLDDEKNIIDEFFNYYFERKLDALESASRVLSKFTHYAGIAIRLRNNSMYYCGLSYLLEQPEFSDIDEIRLIFRALEEDRLLEIIHKDSRDVVEVIIGKETNCLEMSNCSLIISECADASGQKAKIALLGPRRMAYHRVMPMMLYMNHLIEQSI